MSDKVCEVVILRRYCKGCGLCVEVCSKGKLRIDPNPDQHGVQPVAVREEAVCTGCLKCTTICPDAAIEIYRVAETASSPGGQGRDEGLRPRSGQ